jgi:hypothetical protein
LLKKGFYMSEKMTRREIMKKAVYVAPAILTLAAAPSFAKGGSGRAGKSSSYSSWSPKRDQSPKIDWNPRRANPNKP